MSGYTTIQASSSQSSSAIGSAKAIPRAKLWRLCLAGRGKGLSGQGSSGHGISPIHRRLTEPAVSALFQDRSILHGVRPEGNPPDRRAARSTGGSPIRSRKFARRLLAAPVAWLIAGTANAQEPTLLQPENLVEQRRQTRIRFGSMTALPTIEASTAYDSNIYNRADSAADMVTVLRPAVEISTGWPRHAASLQLAGELRRYRRHSKENSLQYGLTASGRLDLAHRMTVTPSATFARRTEQRGSFGDQLSDEPISYIDKRASVRVARTGGRLELAGEVSFVDLSYDDISVDGTTIDGSFRDLTILSMSLRADLEISWRVGLFVTGAVEDLGYRQDAALSRDSRGYSLLGGATVLFTDQVQAEVGLGLVHQDFESPLATDFTGVDFSIKTSWTPLPQLRLTLAGQRSFERSPSPEVSAVLDTRFTAAARYALGGKWLVGVELGYVRDDFRGSDRRERRLFAELLAEYRLTPTTSVIAGVAFRRQSASGHGGIEYSGVTPRFALKFTP